MEHTPREGDEMMDVIAREMRRMPRHSVIAKNTQETPSRIITIMSRLKGLDSHWNDKYELFALNDTLCLVRMEDGLIIEDYPNILCDGGDPKTENRDGNTYLVY